MIFALAIVLLGVSPISTQAAMRVKDAGLKLGYCTYDPVTDTIKMKITSTVFTFSRDDVVLRVNGKTISVKPSTGLEYDNTWEFHTTPNNTNKYKVQLFTGNYKSRVMTYNAKIDTSRGYYCYTQCSKIKKNGKVTGYKIKFTPRGGAMDDYTLSAFKSISSPRMKIGNYNGRMGKNNTYGYLYISGRNVPWPTKTMTGTISYKIRGIYHSFTVYVNPA